MCKENLLTKFTNEEFGEIRVITIDEEPMFIGKDLVEKLGYKIEGSHSYTDYIKKYCDEEDYIKMNNLELGLFGISDLGRKGGYLVNESGMYSLVLESDLPSAKKFKRWVTKEVLPSIRKHGAYVGENADENYINNELRFGNKTTIKTFANADPAMVNKLYEEFREYIDDEYKDNTKIRKSRYLSVDKGLTRLLENIGTNVNNIGLCYNIQVLKHEVLSDIKTLTNRVSGGKRAGLTRKNNKLNKENYKLKQEIELLNPPMSKFLDLETYGFSFNKMYHYYKNKKVKRTVEYNDWLFNFPYDKIFESFNGVDLTRPAVMFAKYIAPESNDVDNFVKSTQDAVASALGCNDNKIHKINAERIGYCDRFEQGKIFVYLRNLTEDEINENKLIK